MQRLPCFLNVRQLYPLSDKAPRGYVPKIELHLKLKIAKLANDRFQNSKKTPEEKQP